MGACDKESGCLTCAHGIACDLLANELVVGDVVVKGAHDVVTVDPGILAIKVRFGAICLGPADGIEPVLRPTLAEVRGGEEFIDELLVCLRVIFRITDEARAARGRGREAGESDGGTAHEGKRVGLGVRFELHFFESPVEEGIDGVAFPGWDFRTLDGLEGPVV